MLRRHLMFSGEFFSPFGVGNPALWLSSRHQSSLWKERTTPTTKAILNGDVVGTWMDLSGNARNVTAPSDAARPTLATGSLGGWPGVLFDGSDDGLVSDFLFDLATGKQLTLFAVASPISVITPFLTLQRSALRDYSSGLTWYTLATENIEHALGIGSGGTATTTFRKLRHNPVALSVPRVMTLTAATTESKLWLNGSEKTLTNPSGTLELANWLSAGSGSHRITVGAGSAAASNTLNYFGNLYFYEAIAYLGLLTDSQRQYVERGLGRAYGITVA